MSQKLPLGGFKWVKNKSKFNEDFIKNYKGDSDIEYFLVVSIRDLEKSPESHNIYHFFAERMKIRKAENLEPACMIK